MLWDWAELLDGLGLSAAGMTLPDRAISGISIDSRTLVPGDLFIALSGDPGERFKTSPASAGDGHQFVQMAADKGAAAVLVHQDVDCVCPVLRVSDTLDALWTLASCARSRCPARVIALTGSSGKTTARSFLEHLLAGYGLCHATVGSLNNHWGLPLSLARMPRESEFAVLEIGTNHPGEISPLARLARPHVAMVLNVLPAHIGNFSGLDAIRVEKLTIAEGLESGGVLVAPDSLELPSGSSRYLTFGDTADADVRHIERVSTGVGSTVRCAVRGREITSRFPFQGEHLIRTGLACLAIIEALGLDLDIAVQRTASVNLPVGRGNRHERGGIGIIDDSYNANPASMGHALDQLRQANNPGKKIALLGEILELGDGADDFHLQLAKHLDGIDDVILFGPGMRVLFEALHDRRNCQHLESVNQFQAAQFIATLNQGDEILIKGSNKVFWVHGFVNRLVQLIENLDTH